ncbi:carbohydrate ABC transporter permease [Thermosipho ferrireducens]|uniref:Carbohydrate ABC transporter permease n=1 Tax=Thermosipho ferrireducens TaxID=2571116 RepID=A0ABX7S9Y0_9BACT|nr:carbohydrate ABC transporter permease [Thermosipho ferrireducens]QTA38208.1 carbohydrate ABC transporter permease [Thermosipho ferrireducens]
MKKKKIGDFIIYFFLFLGAIIWIYPYFWLLFSSFKPSSEIYTQFWPTRFTLDHYKFIFVMAGKMQRPFLRALGNSIYISFTVTFSVVLTSAFFGYVLAKLDYKGRKTIFNFILFQMLFPGFMFIVPLFVLIRNLRLLNTYSAIILPAIVSAWGTFMFTQAYKSIPSDYIEAAKIDGANTFWIVTRVMFPLVRSTASIVGLFTFIGTWDNFMWPLIVMKDYEKMPLSVLLASFNHEYSSYVGPILAGSVIQTIPMVLIFLMFRKYFLQGISLSLK